MDYGLHLLIIITTYATLAVALQVMTGYAGLFSVAQAGLFGLGAYTAIIAERSYHVPIWISPVIAAVICGVVCYLTAMLLVRLRNDEFFLATLGLQILLIAIFLNAEKLTGGALGLFGITPFMKDTTANRIIALLLLGGMGLVTTIAARRIVSSSTGRILQAARDDQQAALACGKNVARARREMFAWVGIVAGITGALYAHYVTAIDPTTFSLSESILLVAIIVIGGRENIIGTIIATAILILLPEAFRYLPLPTGVGQYIRQILFGVIFVVVVMFRPEGLLSRNPFKRNPSRPVQLPDEACAHE